MNRSWWSDPKAEGNWNGVSLAQAPPADLCDLSTTFRLEQKLKRLCQALSEVLGVIVPKWRPLYQSAWDETLSVRRCLGR